MSLHEKKIPSIPSLSQESGRAAITNMLFGAMLWTGIMMTISILTGETSLATNPAFLPVGFLIQTVFGFMVALLPTLIGAMLLQVWLQRNNASQKSAMIAGAVTGMLVILALTIPASIFGLVRRSYGLFSVLILQLAAFNLPIVICAALAGGRTGLQLAKFIEMHTQNLIESEQDNLAPTQT
jgi:drug/metabolite transporter superfamily protein YnfA